jgi:hypothetical protein
MNIEVRKFRVLVDQREQRERLEVKAQWGLKGQ